MALKAATLAGCGAFVAGVVLGWFVLHKIPTLVISTDQGVVLTFVGGVFALTIAAATACYATVRWRHARSIPSEGSVRATGVGLLIALTAIGGVVVTIQPWGLSTTNVLVVSALGAGEYLAQQHVAGGSVVFGKGNTPVVYLHTTRGTWVEATIPQSAVSAVDQDISMSHGVMYTQSEIALGIGGRQQNAIRARTEWLWILVAMMGAWTGVSAFAARRRWRDAPWLAPISADTLQAMVRAQSDLS